MRVWIAWHRADPQNAVGSAEEVGARLAEVFGALAGKRLRVRAVGDVGSGVASIELPWVGWRPGFYQEDDETWAMSVDYPVGAGAALRSRGVAVDLPSALPGLCRELERDAAWALERLAPPFSVVWSPKASGELFVQNDGLGMSQVFEYAGGGMWAASNKIAAFAALGVRLEPEAAEWALWASLGWFPRQTTGYKGIRFLEAGTQLRVGPGGVRRERHDVLGRWITPVAISPADCLELGRQSLLDHILEASSLWDSPEVGLTAGWDSRAVVSSMRAAKVDFSATVRGLPERADVVVSSELARRAGLELRVQGSGGVPPEDVGECRRCIGRALLWQGGHAAAHRHKTFMAGRTRLKLRPPSVTGQHGEVARRERALFGDDRGKSLRALDLTERAYEEFTLASLLEDVPRFLRGDLRERVEVEIREAYHEADRYGLTGLRRVDFFCLNEFTRRKGGAVHAWQARAVVAPLLNPGFIRAVFGYPARREENVFHRHVIAVNSPDWVEVPYNDDRATGASPVRTMDWKAPSGRENYDSALYWQTAGKSLIDEALRGGGFWTEVFDPDLVAKHWDERPDVLAILHVLGCDKTHLNPRL